MRAFVLIHLRNRDRYVLTLRECGIEKQMGIGRFDVTIQKQGWLFGVDRDQAGRGGCFARAALAACSGYFHP